MILIMLLLYYPIPLLNAVSLYYCNIGNTTGAQMLARDSS